MNGIAHSVDQIMRPSFYADLGQGRPRGVTLKAARKAPTTAERRINRDYLAKLVPMPVAKCDAGQREEVDHANRKAVVLGRIKAAGRPVMEKTIYRVSVATAPLWNLAVRELVASGEIIRTGNMYGLPDMQCVPFRSKADEVVDLIKCKTGEFTRMDLVKECGDFCKDKTITVAINAAIEEGLIVRVSVMNQKGRYKRT